MPDDREIVPLWLVFELQQYTDGYFAGKVVEVNISLKAAELRFNRVSADETATEEDLREAAKWLEGRRSDLQWFQRGPDLAASPQFMEALGSFFEAFTPAYGRNEHEEIQMLLEKKPTDPDVPVELLNLHLAWGTLQECALPILASD